jgi:hypothetical protein
MKPRKPTKMLTKKSSKNSAGTGSEKAVKKKKKMLGPAFDADEMAARQAKQKKKTIIMWTFVLLFLTGCGVGIFLYMNEEYRKFMVTRIRPLTQRNYSKLLDYAYKPDFDSLKKAILKEYNAPEMELKEKERLLSFFPTIETMGQLKDQGAEKFIRRIFNNLQGKDETIEYSNDKFVNISIGDKGGMKDRFEVNYELEFIPEGSAMPDKRKEKVTMANESRIRLIGLIEERMIEDLRLFTKQQSEPEPEVEKKPK